MRRTQLIVYGIVFGIGLVLGTILFRPAGHGPAPRPGARGFLPPVAAMPHGTIARSYASPPASKPAVAGTESQAQRPEQSPAVVPPQLPRPTTSPPPASRSSAVHVAPPPPISVHPPTPGPAGAPPGDPVGRDAEGPSSIVVAPTPDDAASPTAQQPPAESPRYHVQVGVFSTAEGAQALVQRLQSLGYVATAPEGGLHRVWVGGYFDRETAERLAANLRKAGFDASIVP